MVIHKYRTKDNSTVKTMTDAQHRAASMLVTYGYKINDICNKYHGENTHISSSCEIFLKSVLPIMLHAAGLPELRFDGEFRGTTELRGIVDKINSYLRYIDRKYDTWYEMMELECVA